MMIWEFMRRLWNPDLFIQLIWRFQHFLQWVVYRKGHVSPDESKVVENCRLNNPGPPHPHPIADSVNLLIYGICEAKIILVLKQVFFSQSLVPNFLPSRGSPFILLFPIYPTISYFLFFLLFRPIFSIYPNLLYQIFCQPEVVGCSSFPTFFCFFSSLSQSSPFSTSISICSSETSKACCLSYWSLISDWVL